MLISEKRMTSLDDLLFDPVQEAEESKAIEQYVRENGCLIRTGDENESNRKEALEILETMIQEWTSSLLEQTKESTQNEQRTNVVLPTLITFGSYRLRVHRLDSDVDVLSLFPDHVSREMFFSGFTKVLEKDERVSKVLSIQTAYTPIIKFYLNGINIDMLFGRVSNNEKLVQFHETRRHTTTTQDGEYFIDDQDLVGVDELTVRSINGVRVTQYIESIVADHIDDFRVCLCAIKQWAAINGIYSNVLGFLGGVNYAILLAKVCLESFPNLNESCHPSVLLKLFFRKYAFHKWPLPIMLTTKISHNAPPKVKKIQVWDPKLNPRDARHVMPIITPAYPSMNSSYNVGFPQLRRIQEEMIQAAILLEEREGGWKNLFRKTSFFQRHSNFLQIKVSSSSSSSSSNATDHTNWMRFCQTKLRLLINSLESLQMSAWPFSNFFHQDTKEERSSFFFIALRFTSNIETLNLKQFTLDFLHKVNSWEERKPGMDIDIQHVLQEDLPKFLHEEDNEEENLDNMKEDGRLLDDDFQDESKEPEAKRRKKVL